MPDTYIGADRMDVLTIDGVVMPKVKSMTVSAEKIWSKNAGRAADGEMQGDLIAIKLKVEVVFSNLTDEQNAVVDSAISPAFFDAKFRNPRSGNMETHTMYAGTPMYPVYSYVDGVPRYVGTGVDLIER